jgi:hypothetical protein
MYTQFAPMSSSAVQFAKDYRAEQIRAAEQSRRAASFRTPRRSPRDVLHSLVATAATQMHGRAHRQATTQST